MWDTPLTSVKHPEKNGESYPQSGKDPSELSWFQVGVEWNLDTGGRIRRRRKKLRLPATKWKNWIRHPIRKKRFRSDTEGLSFWMTSCKNNHFWKRMWRSPTIVHILKVSKNNCYRRGSSPTAWIVGRGETWGLSTMIQRGQTERSEWPSLAMNRGKDLFRVAKTLSTEQKDLSS